MRKTKRYRFTNREDHIIRESIKNFGEDWDAISKKLNGRTPKQIHDRYINYLRQGLVNGPWTIQEDEILMNMYIVIGPKWSQMMKNLPGRSGNNIKNRWHKHLIKYYIDNEQHEINLSSKKLNCNDQKSKESFNGINSQNSLVSSGNERHVALNSSELYFIQSYETLLHSNNKNTMTLEDKNQCKQNFDFENNGFGVFHPNPYNCSPINNQDKSTNKYTNPIKLINKVEIGDKSKEYSEKTDQISNPVFSLFTNELEIQGILEDLNFQNIDFPWN